MRRLCLIRMVVMSERMEAHLLPHEVRIWRKFFASPPFPIDHVAFDLRLGMGIPIDPEWPAGIQRMARLLTQKRVDVVVKSGNEVWILEIKRRAGLSALGQLLGYGVLYMAEFSPGQSPRLGVIAEGVMSDIGEVMAEFGIVTFLV